jgi:alpha-L-rhamnosidase
MPFRFVKGTAYCIPMALGLLVAWGQEKAVTAPIPAGRLDPARSPAELSRPPQTRLTEEFIWTRGDAAALDPAVQASVRGQNDKTEPHYFRRRFRLNAIPMQATLYVAGPRSARIFLNGIEVLRFADDGSRPKGLSVVSCDVARTLRNGENVLAMEVVRSHSSLHTGANATINQVTYGEVLVVKVTAGGLGVEAAPLVVSDQEWRSALRAPDSWSLPAFDDSTWPQVQSLGVIGSRSDFLQWNADAGLYAWPGYAGIGSALRIFHRSAVSVRDVSGAARLVEPNALTGQRAGAFSVLPSRATGEPASLTLDFGREISGRIRLISFSSTVVTVGTSYGESAEEALGHPYLGVRQVTVPARGIAFGPKSAFRFVHLTFPAGASRWSRIDVEGIAYPVRYLGSFESSDPLLNRIWETGAYTAHLCMQEGIWDAPKRDRGRWMGDLDVTGRVISSVFAERSLMEQTLDQVIGDSPVMRDVNTIPGYSALWISGQADFYRHSGDLSYLKEMHQRLLELLRVTDAELDSSGLFTNPGKHKVFVDWSTEFSTDTPEARAATQFEFYLAYKDANFLLAELGDAEHANEYRQKAAWLESAAQNTLLDPNTGTFGDRWQTNAMAVVAGAATAEERSRIWPEVLAHVDDDTSSAVVTPYYGYYVLTAMAALNHRTEALQWMRKYWGGMIAEGATSFWETYDPRWPKHDFHAYLEADNKTGYYASLAHGWSSGPTAWLIEQILGIEPTGAGFREVTIRPDLAGLAWARGSEPTPRGLIRVAVRPDAIRIGLPAKTRATVVLPFPAHRGIILQNGHPIQTSLGEDANHAIVNLNHAGNYSFTRKAVSKP